MMRIVCVLLWSLGLAPMVAAAPALPEGFIVIAHRGVVTPETPENSLGALEAAIARGYTHVEVDVRCTKDGHAVCVHDATLRRGFGIAAKVEELTLAELHAAVPPGHAPSFEQFCAAAAGRVGLMPDLKGASRTLLDAYIESVRTSLHRHGLAEGAYVIGRADVKERLAGEVKVSWRVPLEAAKHSDLAGRNPGARYYIFNHAEDFSLEAIRGFQEMGLQVIVSVNLFHYPQDVALERGRRDVAQMIEWGVDGVQIDAPYDPVVFGPSAE